MHRKIQHLAPPCTCENWPSSLMDSLRSLSSEMDRSSQGCRAGAEEMMQDLLAAVMRAKRSS